MNEIIDDQFNWNFPPNTFGADEGQSGTETIFSDEDNLGRESSQNSINNPIKEDEKVLVKYQFKNLNSDLFPKKNDYLKRIQSAKKFLDDESQKLLLYSQQLLTRQHGQIQYVHPFHLPSLGNVQD